MLHKLSRTVASVSEAAPQIKLLPVNRVRLYATTWPAAYLREKEAEQGADVYAFNPFMFSRNEVNSILSQFIILRSLFTTEIRACASLVVSMTNNYAEYVNLQWRAVFVMMLLLMSVCHHNNNWRIFYVIAKD